MSSNTSEPTVVNVSGKGQATIPKPLREKFGIEAPGEVFIYEDEGRIVVEPVPTLSDLHGIHAGDHDPGEVLAEARDLRAADREREEREADELVDRHGDGD
ncbi:MULTISPECIES: AbrB/MazE/SpoVT family DNA-binding domain-containing protein [Haloglomus]|jgi:antitoxin PrlF|uniref:AbrB/MazE/SpoVT family DNA-binding domain-containing protein n=1 Tax=Haloglomus TaxID=2806252 RepID=UPI0020C9CBE8|nr:MULTISPECIES: AbrB/MazE/SpoVT family DNA-binding domain-containing protein [Haloglomus]